MEVLVGNYELHARSQVIIDHKSQANVYIFLYYRLGFVVNSHPTLRVEMKDKGGYCKQ